MSPKKRLLLDSLLQRRVPSKWCPHTPHLTQLIFLGIDDLEALFGGAAGGGKSDALLMAALQYVDQPNYAALILRRQAVDLEKKDSILDRAKKWWLPLGVKYQARHRRFTFPSGATIEFGHLQNPDDVTNYQSAAFNYIAFDELTQFTPDQYLYMFSRLRRAAESDIPSRVRSASNPGGANLLWYRERFMSIEFARQIIEGTNAPTYVRHCRLRNGDEYRRWFVPSMLEDNPSLDIAEYERALGALDIVEWSRLRKGNWLIGKAGRFKPDWFLKRYEILNIDTYRILTPEGNVWKAFHVRNDCERFMTVDPAATAQELEQEVKGQRPASHSVISTWDYISEVSHLLWRNVVRLQAEVPDVTKAIYEEWQAQGRPQLFVETDGIGRSVFQYLERDYRIPVLEVATHGKNKVERSVPAQNQAAAGRIILPSDAAWLAHCEQELYSWQGTKKEVADQIDTLSHAVKLMLDGSIGGEFIFDGVS